MRIFDSNNSPKFDHNLTGLVLGHKFSNGIVATESQYWANFFERILRFKEITPENVDRSCSTHQNPMSALFIHNGGIGDVLFMTPAIRYYKQKHPDCKIFVSTSQKAADLFIGNKDVDAVIPDELRTVYHNVCFEDYDEVFCFDGELTLNPYGTIHNAYDLFMECVCDSNLIGTKDKVPVINIGDVELEYFKNAIQQIYGMDLTKDKLVVMQYEASNGIRNIDFSVMIESAREIVKQYGYYVIMVGLNPKNKNIQYKKCSSCGTVNDGIVNERVLDVIIKCKKCSHRIKFSYKPKDDIGKKIIFVENASLRDIILYVYLSKCVIGVDSCCLHIAGAFQKPALGLFGPIDGDLRMRYFKYGHWIQGDVDCGPCGMHCHECINMDDNKKSRCMNQITSKMVLDKFKYIDMRIQREYSEPFILQYRVIDRKDCPICHSEDKFFVLRRGIAVFYKCSDCDAIFTDQIIDGTHKYDNKDYYGCYVTDYYKAQQVNMARFLDNGYRHRFNFHGRFLDIGCGGGHIVAEMKRLGWVSEGVEVGEKNRQLYKDLKIKVYNSKIEELIPKGKYDLILLDHVIEHIHYPYDLMNKLQDLLTPNGRVVVIMPDTDKWNHLFAVWIYHNTSFAGEHTIMYNRKCIEYLAGKTNFEIADCDQFSMKHRCSDQLWVELKRAGDR